MKKGYKWFLGLVVVVVLAFAWKYPLLGFVVPVVVIAALWTSVFRGRYFCGNYCPRGSFFDTWLSLAGRRKKFPAFFSSMKMRPLISIALVGFMVVRVSQNPGDWQHWGVVFWEMCLFTTIIAVLLGLLYRPRTWCAFCPVGTLQKIIGSRRSRSQPSAVCKGCGICEKHCPLQLPWSLDGNGACLTNEDCLKCGLCPVSRR